MKPHIALCALALTLAMAAGCAQRQASPLEAMVEQAASQCPIDMGDGQRLISVAYDRHANMVRYIIAIDEQHTSLEQLGRGDYAKRTIVIMSQQQGSKDALRQMAEQGAGLAVTYRRATSGEQLTVTLTPTEVRQICQAPTPSTATIGLEYVKSVAEMENAGCPQTLDRGITLKQVLFDGQWLTYICQIDEQMYSLAAIEASRQQTADDIASAFHNPRMRPLLQALVGTGCGLRYRYLGQSTGNDAIFDFTATDLEERLNDDMQ